MTIEQSYAYRTLKGDDHQSWAALRQEGARDFPLGFLFTAEEAATMTSDEARSILNKGHTRGVFDASYMIGYCGLQIETLQQTRHRAEIGPFYVTSAYQGCGAARVLLDGVIREARMRDVEQLELYVDVGNTRALAFYKRFGFERVSVHPDGFRIDGKPRDAYFCILRI
ncbi:hypothetical protein OCH239_15350 [Roseivivax halodurans JCM 10272]|uniref:N-acetyltransferase domain-containing protein n=1 Tax=Roseivivax halodurans JCM 10272 TaxID=1449350 RepID=X7EAH8_9RHOB|nr:GNAT family N-acetyltransferase [Roseivivax halodurans]ETX12912.1 hypothetical protein OCH239_15350 [Roseivivax halodurans JCM 10272]